MFSHRLAWPPRENRLSILLKEKRRRQEPLLDLTESNPTRVGLAYPAARLAEALADPGVTSYDPDPRGLAAAREAVAAFCVRHGQSASPDRLLLTASTSEAYALLFKMLADPGDAILTPRPSYPLFDDLAALEAVRPTPYPIILEHRWQIDLDGLAGLLDGAGPLPPRALVLVNPNNPTGNALRPKERRALEDLCAPRDVAIISDEVFLDYRFETAAGEDIVSMAGARPSEKPSVLSFTLGGLSKSCGLPQMKLGWILMHGPESLVRQAMERLELIADTYLSVGTPVQRAAARLLLMGEEIGEEIRDRVRRNRGALAAAVPQGSSCRLLPADGGWYAVLQVPAVQPEEDLVLGLLGKDGVVVHPGYFFDFPREAFLVLSLLPDPATVAEAIEKILQRVAG